MTHRIPVSSTKKIIETASAAGIRSADLCRHARLDAAMLTDERGEMPFDELVGLYGHAADLTGDTAFGLHVGERDRVTSYGLLGYVTINSRTVGEGLERLVRFQHIRTDALRYALEVDGPIARLSYSFNAKHISPAQRRHEAESTLASIVRFGRMMTGFDWKPREVHFEHVRPTYIDEHERIFRSPVRFGQLSNEIVFDTSFLSRKVIKADVTLGALLEGQAVETLSRLSQNDRSFVDEVRRAVRQELPRPEGRMQTVCRKSGVGERTLHRRLSAAGTSYRELLDEVRCDIAKTYLQQPDNAVCEISGLLGFSEPSAFHRAFRRWTGITPKTFRRQAESVGGVRGHSKPNSLYSE